MLNQVSSSSTEQQQQQQRASSSAGASLAGQNSAAQQPSLANPVSGPVYMAWGLWNRYGPSIMAQGTAFLASVAAAPPATASGGTVHASTHNARDIGSGAVASSTSVDTSRPISIIERRRQLEAELAQLPPLPHPASFASTAPSMGSATGSSPEMEGASVYLPTGGDNGGTGRYERIDRDEAGGGSDGSSSPISPSRAGWFTGWGASKAGYEKLKEE
jgi:receptor expression-enhancing protein 1/2/3/4